MEELIKEYIKVADSIADEFKKFDLVITVKDNKVNVVRNGVKIENLVSGNLDFGIDRVITLNLEQKIISK